MHSRPHGKFCNLVPARSIAESVFFTQLLQGLKNSLHRAATSPNRHTTVVHHTQHIYHPLHCVRCPPSPHTSWKRTWAWAACVFFLPFLHQTPTCSTIQAVDGLPPSLSQQMNPFLNQQWRHHYLHYLHLLLPTPPGAPLHGQSSSCASVRGCIPTGQSRHIQGSGHHASHPSSLSSGKAFATALPTPLPP